MGSALLLDREAFPRNSSLPSCHRALQCRYNVLYTIIPTFMRTFSTHASNFSSDPTGELGEFGALATFPLQESFRLHGKAPE